MTCRQPFLLREAGSCGRKCKQWPWKRRRLVHTENTHVGNHRKPIYYLIFIIIYLYILHSESIVMDNLTVPCILYVYIYIFNIHMVIQWFIIWYVCMIFSCDMRCPWNLDAGFQFAAWKGSGCTWIYCIVVSNQKSVSQAWTYRMILWKQLQYELPGCSPTAYWLW